MLPADVYSLALLLWEIWMCCSDFSNGTLSWYPQNSGGVQQTGYFLHCLFVCFQEGLLHSISCHMNVSWEPVYPQRASFCMCVIWTWGLPYRNTGKCCHRYLQIYYCLGWCFVIYLFYNLQGAALEEILTDCWDSDPDARLTAQCVADRLVSLQSCHKAPLKQLHASICVSSV